MSGIGELLARISSGLFQQAFVVAELDAAEQAMRATLGCGEFVNLPASDLDYDLRGGRVSCAIALGFARSGNMQIELLQPVRGEGLHVEFLASNGPGAASSRLHRRRPRRGHRARRGERLPERDGQPVRELALLLPRHVGRARRVRRARRGSRRDDDGAHALALTGPTCGWAGISPRPRSRRRRRASGR